MWSSVTENWVFWATAGIFNLIMLVVSPSKLLLLYVIATILYILTGLFSEWHNIFYGIEAYAMWSVLLLPFNGIPLIIIAIVGFVTGKWIASL